MAVRDFNGRYSSIVPSDDEPTVLENNYIRAAVGLLYTFIFVICFFGNLAVVLVISLHRKRRSVSKFCLGNMAVVNLAVSIFCIFQNLTLYLLDDWIFGELMCKMYHFVTNLSHAASMLILVAISVERYIVLLHPSRCGQIRTTQAHMLIILSVWLISAAISLPSLFYFHTIQIQLSEKGDFAHICVPSKSVYNSATAATIYFLLVYVVPLVVLLSLYLRVGWFLRQGGRLRGEPDEENTRAERGVPTAPQIIGLKPLQPDMPPFNAIFTFRGQVLPPKFRPNLLYRTKPGTNNWRGYPKHLLCFVSAIEPRAHLDEFVRGPSTQQGGKRSEKNAGHFGIPQRLVTGDTKASWKNRRNASTGLEKHTGSVIASSSIIRARPSLVIKAKDQRILYRYSAEQLSHIRCKQSRQVARMFIFIILTFATLNLPYHARKLCLNYHPSFDVAGDTNNLIASLTFALMYSNCALNPLLYVLMSKYFRACLSSFFRRRCCKSERIVTI